ncbi:MAG: glycosyltransferase 87 family protein [Actinomycetota bacterium]
MTVAPADVRHSQLSLRMVLLTLAATLTIGLLIKAPCATGSWADGRPEHLLCYSDIVPLYVGDGLSATRIPYFDARNEYPVGQGAWMYVFALPVSSAGSYFLLNAAALAVLALVTTMVLYRLVGSRALYFAAAPALALYGFLNWDLLPVALSTLAIAAFLSRRVVRSGVFLGLATAAKLFPALFLVPFAADLRREARSNDERRLVGWTIGIVAAINLPFVLFAAHGWSYFLRFTSARPVNEGTVWFVACQPFGNCNGVLFAKILPIAAFVAGSVAVWRLSVRADPQRSRWELGFPLLIVFMITNKVYSPQYDLWLLPWFALVFPSLRHYVAVQAASVAVFVATFSQVGSIPESSTLSLRVLELAVLSRAFALLICVVAFVRARGTGALEDDRELLPSAI